MWWKDHEKKILGVASLLMVFVVWHLASLIPSLHRLLPAPLDVFAFLYRGLSQPIGRKYTIFGHILWSLSRVMVGFVSASAVGIILGVAMSWSKLGGAILRSFYLMLRPIPAIAWIPLAILWFGIGEMPKYYIIFIGCLLIVMTNTADGVRGVDPNLLGVARMLGARENQLFTRVVLPSAVPQIFAGLQVGLGVSWATMVAAEMVRSNEGVGWIIIVGQDSINMTQIFGGIILIGLVGLALISIMRFAEARLCAWNVRGK